MENGYPQYFGKVINAMNIISLRVRIDREDVDLYEDDVVSFSRVLDMRAGVLTREFVIRRERARCASPSSASFPWRGRS